MADGAPDRKRVTLDGTDTVENGVWWTKPDAEIGEAMVQVAQQYEAAMEPRREKSRRYVQLHKGQMLTHSMLDAAFPGTRDDDALCWNVVQAGANTAMSVVTRNRVRVTFETTGGNYELQEAAKLAELFVAGAFAGNKLYEQLDQIWFLDAAVPGLGALVVEPDVDGNASIERIIPDELIYNEVEAIRGKPAQMFTVTWMSRWQAVARYAGDDKAKRAAIEACQAYQLPVLNVPDKHIPLIPVYRGWFLPSKRGGDDGRRVVAVPGAGPGVTLEVSPWKWPRFPIAFLRTEVDTVGIWGIPLAKRLAGFQYRINELNYDIEQAARLGSVGKWMVDTGSSVNPDDLNNDHAGIVSYTTTPPKWEVMEGLPRDLVTERDTTYAQAFKDIGLSEWTVGGVQPENIESGEGLRQLREQEQGRAIPAGQQWESAHVELAELVVMAACDAFESHPDMSVTVIDPDGDGLQKVAFKEVAKLLTDPDAWQCRPYPTSILPTSPTGKFEKLREWRADGTIDQATFVALSDMPDIENESSVLLAGIKSVRHAIGQIVKLGEKGYEPPDPAMPLDLALKIAQSTYLRGLRTGMPEAKLQLLMSWIDDVKALMSGQVGPPPPEVPQVDPNAAPAAAPPGAVDPNAVPPPAAPPEMAAPLGAAAGPPLAAGPV